MPKRNRLFALLMTMNVLLVMGLAAVLLQKGGGLPLLQPAHALPAPGAPGSAAHRRTEIVTAAEKFAPSVVSIGASQQMYLVNPYAAFFNNFTPFPYEEKVPYLGSGVIVDSDGLIVTNYHVVENAKDVFVTLIDGRELPGKVLDADTALDVALIKVEAKNLPAAKIGDNNNLMVGEWVLAMGNPFGNVIGDPTPTVTVGVVSAVKRSFAPNQELKKVYLDMVQTDAAINPGNSGGALINSAGELVGINTFIMSRSGGAEGIGFAIPINRVKAVMQEIVSHGKIRPRWMDFRVQNVTERIARAVGTKAKQGAVISELNGRGPAEAIGLKVGDVITNVDGRPVKTAMDLMAYIWSQQVGSKSLLVVDRGGQEVRVTYEVVEPED